MVCIFVNPYLITIYSDRYRRKLRKNKANSKHVLSAVEWANFRTAHLPKGREENQVPPLRFGREQVNRAAIVGDFADLGIRRTGKLERFRLL
jgi:hypothetical protein